MSEYTPDVWIVVEFKRANERTYKVLAGWYGGYLGSDSWQLNSGIVKVEVDGDFYLFHGYSGSVYRCHKNVYRTSGLTSSVLNDFQKKAEGQDLITINPMPEDTDWMGLEYETT